MNWNGLLSWVLHLDKHLSEMVDVIGPGWVYAVLFAIIFCKTQLRIPFKLINSTRYYQWGSAFQMARHPEP